MMLIFKWEYSLCACKVNLIWPDSIKRNVLAYIVLI